MSKARKITLPVHPRGRLSAAGEAVYQAALEAFAAAIVEIGSRLDFAVRSVVFDELLPIPNEASSIAFIVEDPNTAPPVAVNRRSSPWLSVGTG